MKMQLDHQLDIIGRPPAPGALPSPHFSSQQGLARPLFSSANRVLQTPVLTPSLASAAHPVAPFGPASHPSTFLPLGHLPGAFSRSSTFGALGTLCSPSLSESLLLPRPWGSRGVAVTHHLPRLPEGGIVVPKEGPTLPTVHGAAAEAWGRPQRAPLPWHKTEGSLIDHSRDSGPDWGRDLLDQRLLSRGPDPPMPQVIESRSPAREAVCPALSPGHTGAPEQRREAMKIKQERREDGLGPAIPFSWEPMRSLELPLRGAATFEPLEFSEPVPARRDARYQELERVRAPELPSGSGPGPSPSPSVAARPCSQVPPLLVATAASPGPPGCPQALPLRAPVEAPDYSPSRNPPQVEAR
ncbi:fibrosin-1-like protein isoform X4 [Suncus etruscus]|uniref:fibrosin-1-like protein isoform X4 n=1 Tax=Suncus etruscus TaxID=109475 RepID=UPI00210F558F|nr:fibrosin-1-like protein isoform X4 [Suncus etruscus]